MYKQAYDLLNEYDSKATENLPLNSMGFESDIKWNKNFIYLKYD